MVTIEELNDNPLVVKRILEEVEKQHRKKFKNLKFLNKILVFQDWNLGFDKTKSIEGFDIWNEIFRRSNFTPFNHFHNINEVTDGKVIDFDGKKGKFVGNTFFFLNENGVPIGELKYNQSYQIDTPSANEKVYTVKQVIEQDLVLQMDSIEEMKRIIPEYQREGKFKWIANSYLMESKGNFKSVFFFENAVIKTLGFLSDDAKIINSKQVVTSFEIPDAIISENGELKVSGEVSGKTRINPSDLGERDKIWSWSVNRCKKSLDVILNSNGLPILSHAVYTEIPFDASFTPYNIVSGGATFERPVMKKLEFKAKNITGKKISSGDNIERFVEDNFEFSISTEKVGPSEILQEIEKRLGDLRRELKREKDERASL